MENFGRERRHRYFLLVHYASLLAKEGIEDASAQYPVEALNQTGEFMTMDPNDFYDSVDALHAYQDKMQGMVKTKQGTKSSKAAVNPLLPDGTRKRGRPRKDGGTASAPKKTSTKKVQAAPDTELLGKQTKSGKTKRKHGNAECADTASSEQKEEEERPRKRGRKKKAENTESTAHESPSTATGDGTKSQNLASNQTALEPSDKIIEHSSSRLPDAEPPSEATVVDNSDMAEDVQPKTRGRKRKERTGVVENPVTKRGRGIRRASGRNLAEVVVDGATGSPDLVAETQPAADSTIDRSEPDAQTSKTQSRVIAAPPSESGQNTGEQIAHIDADDDADVSDTRPALQIDPALAREYVGIDLSETILQVAQVPIPTQVTLPLKSQKQRKEADGVRKNLSMARRENEFMRLLEECGGITNTSGRAFSDAHMSLLEELAKAKEPASAPPGTRVDRRTMIAALQSLETQGRVKLLTTTAPLGGCIDSIVKIAYLPTLNQEAVEEFVGNLQAAVPIFPQIKRMDVQIKAPVVTRSAAHAKALEWFRSERQAGEEDFDKNTDRAHRLFSQSDEVIREGLLLEKQTISQLLGYIMGTVQRLKLLHMHLISLFVTETEVGNVPSKEYRVIASEYFEETIPVSLVCKIVMTMEYRDELHTLLKNESSRDTPVGDLSEQIRSVLSVGRSRLRRRIARLLQSLSSLGLVTPLKRTANSSGSVQFADKNGETVPLDFCAFDLKNLPTHWRVSTVAPLYSVADGRVHPWFVEDFPLLTQEQANHYWEELKRYSLDEECAKHRMEGSVSTDSAVPLQYSQRTVTILRRTNHWKDVYSLTWYQQRFLEQFMDETLLIGDDSDATLRDLSYVTSAPVETVKDFYASAEAYREYQAHRRAMEVEKSETSKKRREAKALLSEKGKEARQRRAAHWEELVQQCIKEQGDKFSSDDSLPIRLKRLRQSYLHGNRIRDDHYWCKEIIKALTAVQMSAETFRLFPNVFANRPVVPSALPPAQPASKFSIIELINLQGDIMRASDVTKASTGANRRRKTADVGNSSGK
jgi:hypothetical protein